MTIRTTDSVHRQAAAETQGTVTGNTPPEGDEQRLREQIAAHYQAGATQVVLVPLRTTGVRPPDEHVLAALAPR